MSAAIPSKKSLVAERVSVSSARPRQPHGFRYQTLRLCVVLGASAFAGLHAAPPSPPQLRGVMAVGDAWLASLVLPEQRTQQWRRAGERLGDFVVLAVDPQSATLLDARGERVVVSLPEASVVNRNAPPAEPAAWQHWVNSRDNPMLHQPAELPVRPRDWPKLPAAKQQELIAWYQAHGWQLTVTAAGSGDAAVEFSPLQSEERHAMLARKRHAFLQALTPEQRTLHTAATTRLKDTLTETATAHIAFEASLPPAHREAFRLLGDFTTP